MINCKKSGKGEDFFADGTTYKGDYVDGFFDGQGEFLYPDGSYYKGEFKKGQRHG